MVIAKRVLAGLLGSLAVLTGAVVCRYAIGEVNEFNNPETSLLSALFSGFVVLSIVLVTFTAGIRYLRFSLSGVLRRDDLATLFLFRFLLGIGCFFVGLILSMPFTMMWANHKWPGDGQSSLAAGLVSAYIGVATAIACWIALLIKRIRQHNH